MFFKGRQVLIDGIVNTKVDHFKAGTFHHHAHEIFADIVNVAFDGANDHFTDWFYAGLC